MKWRVAHLFRGGGHEQGVDSRSPRLSHGPPIGASIHGWHITDPHSEIKLGDRVSDLASAGTPSDGVRFPGLSRRPTVGGIRACESTIECTGSVRHCKAHFSRISTRIAWRYGQPSGAAPQATCPDRSDHRGCVSLSAGRDTGKHLYLGNFLRGIHLQASCLRGWGHAPGHNRTPLRGNGIYSHVGPAVRTGR